MTSTKHKMWRPPPQPPLLQKADTKQGKCVVFFQQLIENQCRFSLSVFEAVVHLFKGSVGAGLFAMGDCYKNGGIIGSTILLPIIAIVCVHCEQMLIKGSILAVERSKSATFYDYPDTIEKCFEAGPKPFRRLSKIMKLVVEMFLCVTQFGFCSIYFVFITENLHQVRDGVSVYFRH